MAYNILIPGRHARRRRELAARLAVDPRTEPDHLVARRAHGPSRCPAPPPPPPPPPVPVRVGGSAVRRGLAAHLLAEKRIGPAGRCEPILSRRAFRPCGRGRPRGECAELLALRRPPWRVHGRRTAGREADTIAGWRCRRWAPVSRQGVGDARPAGARAFWRLFPSMATVIRSVDPVDPAARCARRYLSPGARTVHRGGASGS